MMSLHPLGQSCQIMTKFVEENSRVWKRGEIQGAVKHGTCEPHVAVFLYRLSHKHSVNKIEFFSDANALLQLQLAVE